MCTTEQQCVNLRVATNYLPHILADEVPRSYVVGGGQIRVISLPACECAHAVVTAVSRHDPGTVERSPAERPAAKRQGVGKGDSAAFAVVNFCGDVVTVKVWILRIKFQREAVKFAVFVGDVQAGRIGAVPVWAANASL